MKNNKGYLLLESIMSLVIIGTLLIAIYTSLIFCIKFKASIEDKVEIQQQALEISKHIKSTIEKSKGIISVTYNNENSNDNFKNAFIEATSEKVFYAIQSAIDSILGYEEQISKLANKFAEENFDGDPCALYPLLDAAELKWREYRNDKDFVTRAVPPIGNKNEEEINRGKL